MKLVSGFLGLALASAAVMAPASAADIYGPAGGYKDGPGAPALWTGPYIGINGGYAWGYNSTLTGVVLRSKFASDGGLGGAQIGYNWQRGHLVLGAEADFEGAQIGGVTAVGASTAENNLNWFGTVRGRVGYAAGPALLYATGGFAFGGVEDRLSDNLTAASYEGTNTGYTVGAGAEYLFNASWSGKVEYQYVNLGSDTVVNGSDATSFNHEYNTVRVGLNYHIRGFEPLK